MILTMTGDTLKKLVHETLESILHQILKQVLVQEIHLHWAAFYSAQETCTSKNVRKKAWHMRCSSWSSGTRFLSMCHHNECCCFLSLHVALVSDMECLLLLHTLSWDYEYVELWQTKASSINEQYAKMLTKIDLISAQYNESQFVFSAADEQFAEILSGKTFL